MSQVPFDQKMDSITGTPNLLGWGSDSTPWFGGNPADNTVNISGISIPARHLAMHPGPNCNVAVVWRSPIKGQIKIKASVAHAQSGGNGIEWWVAHETNANRSNLVLGVTDGTGSQTIPSPADAAKLSAVTIEPGDLVSLVIGPKGSYVCDSTIIELVITEVGGRGRIWDLTDDVLKTLHDGNPHADGQGNPGVWRFCVENPLPPSQPPFLLDSQATDAAQYIRELKARKLHTIREQIRAHREQTWEGAVTAMRGSNLPPIQTASGSDRPCRCKFRLKD